VRWDRSIECFVVDPTQRPLPEFAFREQASPIVLSGGVEKVGTTKADERIDRRNGDDGGTNFRHETAETERGGAVHLTHRLQHVAERRVCAPGFMEATVTLGAGVLEPLEAPADQGHAQSVQTGEEHGVLHATCW
jgi:hypothetical protein